MNTKVYFENQDILSKNIIF